MRLTIGRRGWVSLAALLLAVTAAAGCDATFEDLRPKQESDDTGADAGADRGPDAGADMGPDATADVADGDLAGDTGSIDGGDASDDAAPDLTDEPGSERVVGTGEFEGRGGYSGEGEVDLVELPDGTFEVRFSSAFQTAGVPGPVVLLSTRSTIGNQVDEEAGDIHLGALESTAGPQTYAAPASAASAQYVWVYCEPFGVEIARAELMEVP